MRLAALLATAFVLMTPTLAAAECSWGASTDMTMSCADGTTWDSASQSCVPTATS